MEVRFVTPKGELQPDKCGSGATHEASEQAQESTSPSKIDVTIKSPVGDISVVTLIRTDTTLDHSQKAEKVCTHKGLQTGQEHILHEQGLHIIFSLRVICKIVFDSNVGAKAPQKLMQSH